MWRPLVEPSVLFRCVLDGPEALQQWRVGIVPHREEPISHRKAQVIFVKLDKGRAELSRSTHGSCKRVCLELESAAQHGQAERQELEK